MLSQKHLINCDMSLTQSNITFKLTDPVVWFVWDCFDIVLVSRWATWLRFVRQRKFLTLIRYIKRCCC